MSEPFEFRIDPQAEFPPLPDEFLQCGGAAPAKPKKRTVRKLLFTAGTAVCLSLSLFPPAKADAEDTNPIRPFAASPISSSVRTEK